MRVHIAIALIACTGLLAGCDVPWEQTHPGALPSGERAVSASADPADPSPSPTARPTATARVASIGNEEAVDVKWGGAVAEMGMALYGPLQGVARTKNLVFSPVSLCWTLTQAAEGSAGDGRLRILELLRLQDVPSEWLQSFTHDAISAYQSNLPGLDFRSADAIWVQEGLDVKPEYIDMAQTYMGSDIRNIALKSDGVATLNAWLREHTLGLAADSVSSRKLTDKPIVALSGAAMLRGAFQAPFEPQNTVSDAFVTASGREVRVPMMAYSGPLPYFESDTAQCVRLPLGDGRFGLTVVMPNAQRKDLLGDLDLRTLRDMWRHMEPRSVDIRLPRFSLDARYEVSELLIKAGMADAFDEAESNLSAMLQRPKGAALAGVWHGASIVVSEAQSGTFAAADAWDVDASLSGVSMRMNRPFFFAVDDSESGALLMLGVVADPRGAEL